MSSKPVEVTELDPELARALDRAEPIDLVRVAREVAEEIEAAGGLSYAAARTGMTLEGARACLAHEILTILEVLTKRYAITEIAARTEIH